MEQTVYNKVSTFFSQYPMRDYPQGQMLIFSGEEPDHIFYILSGRVSQYDISYKGEEVAVNTFLPPAFFPISHIVNKKTSNFFYKCETDTQVHSVPVSDVETFLKDNPEVVYDLLSRVYRGTDIILERMVHLMAGSATERIAYELIAECKRFGQTDDGISYTLNITEVQLASHIGLTRETISREIKKLKVLRILSMNNKGIEIRNLPQLEKYL